MWVNLAYSSEYLCFISLYFLSCREDNQWDREYNEMEHVIDNEKVLESFPLQRLKLHDSWLYSLRKHIEKAWRQLQNCHMAFTESALGSIWHEMWSRWFAFTSKEVWIFSNKTDQYCTGLLQCRVNAPLPSPYSMWKVTPAWNESSIV